MEEEFHIWMKFKLKDGKILEDMCWRLKRIVKEVILVAGKDKGKTGEILEINRKLNKIKIKSIGVIKKHLKPTKENKGGIITKESFIHRSNVKNIDIKKKETIKK